MRPAVVLTVTVLRHRLVDTGVWCDRCALPSAVVLELLLAVGGHLQYLRRRHCTDCRATTAAD